MGGEKSPPFSVIMITMRRILLLSLFLALVLVSPASSKQKPNPWRAFINIPTLHLKTAVTMNVDAGPAFWPVTGRPGGGDTIAIAGHRTTHTRPFTHLNRLRHGDRIYIRYNGKVHAYEVTGYRVLSVRHMHIANAIGHERLLLTACSRPDGTPTSASWRIVVYALPVR